MKYIEDEKKYFDLSKKITMLGIILDRLKSAVKKFQYKIKELREEKKQLVYSH